MVSGGKRLNAGPKAKDGAFNTFRKDLIFDSESWGLAEQFGDGNRSLGVRRSVKMIATFRASAIKSLSRSSKITRAALEFDLYPAEHAALSLSDKDRGVLIEYAGRPASECAVALEDLK